jgi:hypothetical protein
MSSSDEIRSRKGAVPGSSVMLHCTYATPRLTWLRSEAGLTGKGGNRKQQEVTRKRMDKEWKSNHASLYQSASKISFCRHCAMSSHMPTMLRVEKVAVLAP